MRSFQREPASFRLGSLRDARSKVVNAGAEGVDFESDLHLWRRSQSVNILVLAKEIFVCSSLILLRTGMCIAKV